MSELFEDLKRLAAMLEKGEVSQNEYEKIKADLIDESSPDPQASSIKPAQAPSEGKQQRSRSLDAGAWLGGKVPALTNALPKSGGILSKRWVWLLAAIFALILLANAMSPSAGSGGSSGDQSAGHEAVEAYVVCQQFVEDRLKSPSSAEFGGPYSRVTTHNGGGKYTVATHVDSENSFGAMIRNDFVCTVQHTTGDSYRLVNLEFEDQ